MKKARGSLSCHRHVCVSGKRAVRCQGRDFLGIGLCSKRSPPQIFTASGQPLCATTTRANFTEDLINHQRCGNNSWLFFSILLGWYTSHFSIWAWLLYSRIRVFTGARAKWRRITFPSLHFRCKYFVTCSLTTRQVRRSRSNENTTLCHERASPARLFQLLWAHRVTQVPCSAIFFF